MTETQLKEQHDLALTCYENRKGLISKLKSLRSLKAQVKSYQAKLAPNHPLTDNFKGIYEQLENPRELDELQKDSTG